MSTNIYKYAAKKRIRFASKKGNLSVEDLFVVGNDILDEIYRDLKKAENDAAGESLFNNNTANDEIKIKLDIVRDIADTRKEEAAAKLAAADKAAKNKRIEEIIADKEDENLKNMSIDELKALLAK